MTVVKLSKVNKKLGDFSIRDVSFQIPKGSIVGLIGQNGSGKTTIIKLMLDVLKKDSGKCIYWEDETIEIEQFKKETAVVFDELNFYEKMTPKQIEKVMRSIYPSWNSSTFQQLLQKFQLKENQKIGEMSKGMKMKLNISVGLAHHPAFLVLDEPTSGLDPSAREDILDLFLGFIQKKEQSILFSSHITSDLERVADYIVLIHDGQVLLQENKEILLSEYGIARCTSEQYSLIPSELIFSFQEKSKIFNVIVKDKNVFEEAFPDIMLDNLSLDELLTISIKGEILS